MTSRRWISLSYISHLNKTSQAAHCVRFHHMASGIYGGLMRADLRQSKLSVHILTSKWRDGDCKANQNRFLASWKSRIRFVKNGNDLIVIIIQVYPHLLKQAEALVFPMLAFCNPLVNISQ